MNNKINNAYKHKFNIDMSNIRHHTHTHTHTHTHAHTHIIPPLFYSFTTTTITTSQPEKHTDLALAQPRASHTHTHTPHIPPSPCPSSLPHITTMSPHLTSPTAIPPPPPHTHTDTHIQPPLHISPPSLPTSHTHYSGPGSFLSILVSPKPTAHTHSHQLTQATTIPPPPPHPPPTPTPLFTHTNLALALPWASRSTVGTPRRTKRVKRDCSMLEYFWKAMFLMTGGSWWWSPIMIHRFRRLLPSSGFCYRFSLVTYTGILGIKWDYITCNYMVNSFIIKTTNLVILKSSSWGMTKIFTGVSHGDMHGRCMSFLKQHISVRYLIFLFLFFFVRLLTVFFLYKGVWVWMSTGEWHNEIIHQRMLC